MYTTLTIFHAEVMIIDPFPALQNIGIKINHSYCKQESHLIQLCNQVGKLSLASMLTNTPIVYSNDPNNAEKGSIAEDWPS